MQNLGNDNKKAPSFHCKWCAKKFKTQQKYEKHVLYQHPFAAMKKNTLRLELAEKMWLLDELERYSNILIGGDASDLKRATQMLGDGDRMVPIHGVFRERILPHLNKALSSGDQVLRIIDDFQAFLNLGIPWRGGNFCPSLLIDLVWHSAMQNQERYVAMCTRFLGQPLSHCLVENDGNEERFEEFVKQFKHQHGRDHVGLSDLSMYASPNGIGDARNILRGEEDTILAQARVLCVRESQIRYEPMPFLAYTDDGKC